MKYIFTIIIIGNPIKTSNEIIYEDAQTYNKQKSLSDIVKEEYAFCEVSEDQIIYSNHDIGKKDNMQDLLENDQIYETILPGGNIKQELYSEISIQSYNPTISYESEFPAFYSSADASIDMINQVYDSSMSQNTNSHQNTCKKTSHPSIFSSYRDLNIKPSENIAVSLDNIKQEFSPPYYISNDLRGITDDLMVDITNTLDINHGNVEPKKYISKNISSSKIKSSNNIHNNSNTLDKSAESRLLFAIKKRKSYKIPSNEEYNKKICIGDDNDLKSDISPRHKDLNIKNIKLKDRKSMIHPLLNNRTIVLPTLKINCTENDSNIYSTLKIEFNEIYFFGAFRNGIKYHQVRVLFDYNVNNLEKENEKMNIFFKKMAQTPQVSSFYLKNVYRDLHYYLMNNRNQILHLNIQLLKPVVVFWIEIFNIRFKRNINKYYSNFNFFIKSLFYPVYPFYKIIDFSQCSEYVRKFYSDFIQLFEILILLRKLTGFADKKHGVNLTANLDEEYETQSKKCINSKTYKGKIEESETKIKKIEALIIRHKNAEKIFKIFKNHFNEFKLYLQKIEKSYSKSITIEYYRDKIMLICRVICHKLIDTDTNNLLRFKFVSDVNEMPIITHLTDLDINNLFILCKISIKRYIIVQIKRNIAQIILPIEKKINDLIKEIEKGVDTILKNQMKEPNYNKYISNIKKNRLRQILELNIYNINMLVINNFLREHDEIFI